MALWRSWQPYPMEPEAQKAMQMLLRLAAVDVAASNADEERSDLRDDEVRMIVDELFSLEPEGAMLRTLAWVLVLGGRAAAGYADVASKLAAAQGAELTPEDALLAFEAAFERTNP